MDRCEAICQPFLRPSDDLLGARDQRWCPKGRWIGFFDGMSGRLELARFR